MNTKICHSTCYKRERYVMPFYLFFRTLLNKERRNIYNKAPFLPKKKSVIVIFSFFFLKPKMNFLLSFAFSLAVSGITHYHKRYGKYMGKTILDDNEETMLPEKEVRKKKKEFNAQLTHLIE